MITYTPTTALGLFTPGQTPTLYSCDKHTSGRSSHAGKTLGSPCRYPVTVHLYGCWEQTAPSVCTVGSACAGFFGFQQWVSQFSPYSVRLPPMALSRTVQPCHSSPSHHAHCCYCIGCLGKPLQDDRRAADLAADYRGLNVSNARLCYTMH